MKNRSEKYKRSYSQETMK